MSKYINRIVPQDEILLETDIGRLVPSMAQVGGGYAIVDLDLSTPNATLVDKAVNVLYGHQTYFTHGITVPAQTDGKARDFIVVTVADNDRYGFVFLPPDGESVTILPRDGDDDNLTPEDGDGVLNIFMFTEIKPNVFLVSRTKVVEAEVEA